MEITALIVSIVVAAVLFLSLVWKICRDVIWRPRLIVKLKADLIRDFTRFNKNDTSEETFTVRGTITPVNCHTTVEKLELDIHPIEEPVKYGMPFHYTIGKMVSSGKPCYIDWRCQSALEPIEKTKGRPRLVVSIYHTASERPVRRCLPLTTINTK